MIPCTCIDDKNRPADFPLNRWVKEGDKYRITALYICLPQNVLGYSIYEKPCTEDCYPYQYFLSTRFSVTKEAAQQLLQMLKDQAESLSDEQIKQLFKNSNVEVAQQ